MGKKQKIRTGTGDIVTTPGPLHKQIERSKIAKSKFKPFKRSKDEPKDEIELIDPSLKGKIIIKTDKKSKKDLEFNEDLEADNSEENEEHDDLDVEDLVSQHLENLDELKLVISFNIISNINDDCVEKFRNKTRKLDKKSNEEDPNMEKFADIDPKAIDLFSEIGQLLSKYRSGKIPKAFKIIPTLVNWERMIELTRPDDWTAAAMLSATKIFASTATPFQCIKFYNLILLPRIRDDIAGLKKLHFHMYQCLFKALFKPAAFFKGILLPLCKSDDFSLREAVVIASMLRKASIPQMHAATALLSISLFWKEFDNIKHLTVSWHSCLISFVQRYVNTLSIKQKNEIIELVKLHSHHKITPEILKILRTTESGNNIYDDKMEI
ncbi:hypothetical protein Mgra_00002098 [Meloidogyne graminicola]|uniref:Bystin n=1 Tax=Meloidogyne graminicola TaxID=189291 RepID=A0A8S9ZYT6_9BILA|nr:hypothetical protein Mgra_00002098 [Meloidogyne graminicola]